MADNHSLSTDQQHQLAAEAVTLTNGTPDQQSQAQNIAWALNADQNNSNTNR